MVSITVADSPGAPPGTQNIVTPSGPVASSPVRASTTTRSARCTPPIQRLLPVNTQPPSAPRCARVVIARSTSVPPAASESANDARIVPFDSPSSHLSLCGSFP